MSSTITKKEQKHIYHGRSIMRYGIAICVTVLLAGVHLLHAQTVTSNALDFDGADDYVQLPADKYFTQNNFTIEAWVYPRSYNLWSRIIDFSNGPASDNVIMALTDGTSGNPAGSIFNGGSGTNFTASTTLPLNTWSHLAITVSESNSAIYINGELNTTFSNIGTARDIERTLNYIGKSAWSFDGNANMILDELKIWSGVLTADAIADNMNKKPAANQPGLLVYFDFDQGVQEGDNTSVTTLIDKSGNDYHGTFYNFTLDGTGSNFVAGVDVPEEGTYAFAPIVNTQTTIDKSVLAAAFDLTATSTSPAPFTYTLESGTSISLDGATATITGVGTSVVRISQAAVAHFAESNVEVTINVSSVSADLPGTTIPQTGGLRPTGIAHGDLNGDGFDDLAVTFAETHTVTVYHNDGTGVFSEAGQYVVGSNPQSIVVGDLDGDGNLDLATANFDANTVSVLINSGTGTFNTPVEYESGSGTISIVIGDLDGDGTLDLATVNYLANSVSILMNTGDGTFDTHIDYSVGANPQDITTGDFDDDGSLDLATADGEGHTVSILINAGTGTFNTRVPYAAGQYPYRLATGDLDGDGKLDLVTANFNDNKISVLINTGTGGFNAPVSFAAGSNPLEVAIDDLDGDGKLDLVSTNLTDNTVSVLINTGTGTFNAHVTHGVGVYPFALTVGDWNDDAELDLATANIEGNSLSIILNTGGGVFESVTNVSTACNYVSLAADDLDGDGKDDLVIITEENTLFVQMNQGNDTYASPAKYQVGGDPRSVAIGDLNGDGKLDLVTANSDDNTVSALINTGTGTFNTQIEYEVGGDPRSVAIGDLDGDGKLDLATTNSDDNTISVLINTGTGTFNTHVTYAVGLDPRGIALGDLDGDGKLDLVATNTDDNSVSVLINTGTGTFNTQVTYDVGSVPRGIAMGDLDGDGKLDLAAANNDDRTVSVLINTGTGTFDAHVTYSTGYSPQTVTIGDLNGDNKSDLIIANDDDSYVSVLNNTGDGFETQRQYYIDDNAPLSAVIADLNNDGRPDLAGVTYREIFTFSNETELPQTIIFAPLENKAYGAPAFALTATASSGLAVTYTSSNTALATVAGSTVTIVGIGTTSITASQEGAGFYSPATEVEQSLTVEKGNQTISFAPLPDKALGDAAFTLIATGGGSGNAVTYTSSNAAVAAVAGSTVTIVGLGTTSIIASQAGNDNYNAATSVERSLTVNKANQTITFAALANKTFGDATFTLNATGGVSGNALTFTSSNTAVATVAGNTVTIVGAGSTSIIASQAGNDTYNAAIAEQSLTVNKANQTIAFATLANKTLGDAAFTLTATGGASGNVVTYTSNDKVTISGSQVTIVKAGRATILATQEGNANFAAATAVEQSFCVNPGKPVITEDFTNATAPVLTSSASSGNQWYRDNVIIPNATEKTLTVSDAGLYKVTATTDQCTSIPSDAVTILITGISSPETVRFHAYPNPVTDYLTIEFSEAGGKQLEIMGTDGKVVHRSTAEDQQLTVNVSTFSPGLYVVKVRSSKAHHQLKFVKK